MIQYFIVISFASILVTIIDKLNSISRKWRVSEKSLLLFAILGGAFPMYFTMRIIRHKTLHNKFMIGLPIIILIQVVTLIGIYSNFQIF